MLWAYYDISQKEKFEKRFGNLWIGSYPSARDLSATLPRLLPCQWRNGTWAENFNDYCSMVMDLFRMVYEPYYSPGFDLTKPEIFPSLLFYYDMLTCGTEIPLYATAPKVRQMIHDTELHCIIMQFRGNR